GNLLVKYQPASVPSDIQLSAVSLSPPYSVAINQYSLFFDAMSSISNTTTVQISFAVGSASYSINLASNIALASGIPSNSITLNQGWTFITIVYVSDVGISISFSIAIFVSPQIPLLK